MQGAKAFTMLKEGGVNDVKTNAKHGVVTAHLKTTPEWAMYSRENALAISAQSVRSLLHWMQEEMPEPRREGSSSRSGRERGDFYHTKSYEEMMDLFLQRPYEIAQFQEINLDLHSPSAIGNDIEYDVYGDILDIGRFLEDQPEHWGRMMMGNEKGFYATILINCSVVYYIDAELIAHRGQRVVALVDWLESQNIRTEVKAMEHTECGHVEVTVKRFEDPLDLNPIAVVGHPDFLRRTIFRINEYSPTWQSGYGTSTNMREGRMRKPEIEDARNIIIFSEIADEKEELDQAFDSVQREIAEIIESGALVMGDQHFLSC